MAKIKITQLRSAIGRPSRQKKTLEALGLRRLNQSVVHEVNPALTGMVDVVSHLVKVEEA